MCSHGHFYLCEVIITVPAIAYILYHIYYYYCYYYYYYYYSVV